MQHRPQTMPQLPIRARIVPEPTEPIRLIVGLGNPGPDYAGTRHNAGVWLIDALCQHYATQLKHEDKLHAALTTVTIDGVSTRLAVPNTYMNESGRAVQAIAHYFKIPAKHILIVHDELDFACGTARLKWSGGFAGHNGLRDIGRCLGTPDFWRLRIGIDRPTHAGGVSGYVLKAPTKTESAAIATAISESEAIVSDLVHGEFEKAMRYLHQEPEG